MLVGANGTGSTLHNGLASFALLILASSAPLEPRLRSSRAVDCLSPSGRFKAEPNAWSDLSRDRAGLAGHSTRVNIREEMYPRSSHNVKN